MSLTDGLISIIETRAEQIAKAWYQEVKESNYTPTIKEMPAEEAMGIALNVYNKLGYWLKPESDHEVQQTYIRFGESLSYRDFRMEEVVMILVLIKRYLWLHLLAEGIMSTNLEIYQALEVNNKVVLYFDRAIYFALIGYKRAYAQKVAEDKKSG